jgi:hypothetical protein
MAGRVKDFAPWNPQRKTESLLSDIEAVLDEYEAYLPLTVRQVFYRLVGKGYPKSENFYASVGDTCNRARRCGRIPFSAIRDDGVSRLWWGIPNLPLARGVLRCSRGAAQLLSAQLARRLACRHVCAVRGCWHGADDRACCS